MSKHNFKNRQFLASYAISPDKNYSYVNIYKTVNEKGDDCFYFNLYYQSWWHEAVFQTLKDVKKYFCEHLRTYIKTQPLKWESVHKRLALKSGVDVFGKKI